jgi:AraC family transcriptional regulator, transcriptional activator of pobA
MSAPAAGRLSLDRLDAGEAVEVVWLEDERIGAGTVREPHRHDYHEVIWVRCGAGQHLIDGRPVPVRPGTVTLIGRGQVHVFERAEGLTAGVLRFGDELLAGAAQRVAPGWLLAGRGGRTIAVPPGEAGALEAAIRAVQAEAARPPDPLTADVQRHLVAVVLLWIERWYEGARTERRDADDAEVQLHRRFARLLEDDFARHHDAAHYADALAVPPAALSRALTQVTGRSTKELITDRVMLEAARLLRFTDLTVGEVAHQAGFGDPLYFSRAFKRHLGEAPVAYRDRIRGRAGPDGGPAAGPAAHPREQSMHR